MREAAKVDELDFAARRRRRVSGGRRERQVLLRLSDVEHGELVRRAEAAGVSVPRFVMEAALATNRAPAPERIAVAEELLAQSRMLGRAGNNLNQLAAWANRHRGFPARAHRVLEELRVAIVRLQEVARRVEDVYQP